MASFKKFWFVTNWVNKKTSHRQPDSIESLETSSTQLSDAVLLSRSAESEKPVKARCTSKTQPAIKAPGRRKFRADLKKMKASSSSLSLASETTRHTDPSSVLQKSSNKKNKANAANKKAAAKKKTKTTVAAVEEPAVVSEEEIPVKITVDETDERNDNVDPPAEEKAAETAATDKNDLASQDSQTAEGGQEPEIINENVSSEDSDAEMSEPAPSDQNLLPETKSTDEEEPVVSEEGSTGIQEKRKKRQEDEHAGAEQPTEEEESYTSTRRPRSRPTRQRWLRETTTKTVTQTPFTTLSSVSSPRSSGPRKPFSRPLTFSIRSSNSESMNEIERHHSLAHEQYLQRAWTLMNAPLLKLLQTPLKSPDYLKDPPELGSVGTWTSELRREFAKRKIGAMKKSSLELIKDPMMLEMMQSKSNRCEILRTKYAKKEPIITAFFEQHFDRFQRPPFRNVRAMRKCI